MPEEQIAPQQSEPGVNQGEAASTPETTPLSSEVNASSASSPEPGDPALLERLKMMQPVRPEPPAKKDPRDRGAIEKDLERVHLALGKAYIGKEWQDLQLKQLTDEFVQLCGEAEERKKLDEVKIKAAQAKRERKAAKFQGGKSGEARQDSSVEQDSPAPVEAPQEPKAGEIDLASAEGLGETPIP